MRLIDADAMLDDVLRQIETIKVLGNEELTELSLVIYDGIKQEICNQPTIDAVEVVRCRDCKYRYKMACHKAEFYECSHIGLTSETGNITHVGVTDDFFCADGQKMDGEGQNDEND